MPKLMSVITIPLKVEPWQADILNKRMELCRLVYNSLLKKKLRVMSELESNSAYNAALQEINRVYQISDEKLRESEMKANSFQEARNISSSMLKKAGISEYAFITDTMSEAKTYSNNIGTGMVARSIAKPLWASFDNYLYGDGFEIVEKKPGMLNSLASDGKSSIRLVDADGHTIIKKDDIAPILSAKKIKMGGVTT